VTPEARAAAARERKQKIFVAAGGVLLALVLVFFTLPKVLGGGSSSPDAAGTDTTSTTTPTVPGQVAPPPTGAGSPTASAQPVTVAATTKLSSFSAFRRKDPFVQQVATPEQVAAAAASSSASAPGDAGKAAKATKGDVSTQKFSVGTKPAATSTIVTVNGARQVVAPGARFPAADPLFVLVAEKPQAKAIEIGVVGGAYSGGDRTTTLKVGRSLTLVNTTTGAKYKISLVSVGSGEQAAEPTAKQ
jgi:hypothetical protein